MKSTSFFFAILFPALFFSSCNSDSKQAAAILRAVENVTEQNPDSALTLLDSIRNPYELNESRYCRYILCLVRAKDKAYKNIASDTAIFMANDYYVRKNDPENIAWTSFYCGRVLQERDKTEEALNRYLQAKKPAEKINNKKLHGLIEFFIGQKK